MDINGGGDGRLKTDGNALVAGDEGNHVPPARVRALFKVKLARTRATAGTCARDLPAAD